MKFKNIPIIEFPLPICVGPTNAVVKQMDNMSDEEYKVQLALGLLRDWIVTVKDRAALLRKGPSASPHTLDNSHFVYIVVKAINRAHAKRQVKQSGYFPEKDFWICGSWQSDVAGTYYRELFYRRERDRDFKFFGRERAFVLS
ncbi:hypothetical protein LCGC14_2038860 [marine sediment metagenome]|uniref:Uncharacterized protein n=1 Tax=marine sediment metagenome TaxID=412755 RepID=A0A0F9ESP4_9ZZZZ